MELNVATNDWFEEALRHVSPSLNPQPGLRALGRSARGLVRPADTRQLQGSVDIDGGLRASEPQASRWDYAIAYADGVWFVEVHPAASDANVHEVIEKARWLRSRFGDSELLSPPRARGR